MLNVIINDLTAMIKHVFYPMLHVHGVSYLLDLNHSGKHTKGKHKHCKGKSSMIGMLQT